MAAPGIGFLKEQGLVLVSYGSHGVAELADGRRLDCNYRRSVGRPFCGDRVVMEQDERESAVVSAILPRSNVFLRAGARKQKQIIAANLDQVLIVVAAAPEPSRDLIARYLVAVHSMGIQAIIVLNKSDLSSPGPFKGGSPLKRLSDYRSLGYEVLETSCKGPPGTDALIPALESRTSILVGQSGVGKSSLANALLPDLELQTGALSRVTGKGTHTTTTTIMYTLPCSGKLIDSPGVWEYGLWEMSQHELEAGFREFSPWRDQCRFNDCRHSGEPSCSVKEAVDRGEIMEWRYRSYLRLLEQGG
jgi:ribosome biogenesis GTPase